MHRAAKAAWRRRRRRGPAASGISWRDWRRRVAAADASAAFGGGLRGGGVSVSNM